MMKWFFISLVLVSPMWKEAFGETTPSNQTVCHGSWSEWSICFPGTQSNPTFYRDRIYRLYPSKHNATAMCNTLYSVNYVQTEPCLVPDEDVPILDLAETDFSSDGYYQCTNNRWVSEHLLCNGDDDCGDNSDEYPTNRSGCPKPDERLVCGYSQAPSTNSKGPLGERYLTGIPGIEHFAAGFDVLTGTFKGDVLSMAGHGSCRRVLINGDTESYYRLPQNVASLRQMHDVIVDPGKVFEGGSGILNETTLSLKAKLNGDDPGNDLVKRTGMTQSQIIKNLVTKSVADDQSQAFAKAGSHIDTAQITLKEAQSLEVTTEFMRRIMDLPFSNFSYSKYMQLIQDFGTHYVSSGKLGGTYSDTEVHSRCWLETASYEEYSSVAWKENLRECVRASFFTRLNPNSSALPKSCQKTTQGETKTLREEAVDYYVDVSGGSIDSSSNLKFSFSKANWEEWIKSIVNTPSLNPNNVKLENISKLVYSSSIMIDQTRREAIAEFINQAIGIYLKAYDAADPHMCFSCDAMKSNTIEFDSEGSEYYVMNYGIPYVTGTGVDYKCHCVYNMPTDPEITCGALQNLATFLSLFLSVVVAYWNIFEQ